VTMTMNTELLWFFCRHRDGTETIETGPRGNVRLWPKMLSDGGTVTCRSIGYKSEEELLTKHGLRIPCGECGTLINEGWSERDEMLRRELCWTCLHWTKESERAVPANRIIIDHYIYSVGPEPRPGDSRNSLGMAGRKFRIEFLTETMEQIDHLDGDAMNNAVSNLAVVRVPRQLTTHNLWSGGGIPERFWGRLPDNARFLGGAGQSTVDGIVCWDSSR
jgi:hypothetical protein